MVYSLKKFLDNRREKPVIYVNTSNKSIQCLIDTGADTPVWTKGEELLKRTFPNATLCNGLKFELGGFGGDKKELTPVYEIPELTIKSDEGNDYITFKGLLIACCMKSFIPYTLIISATMLKQMNYAIVNIGKQAPALEIEHEKSEYMIRPVRSNKNNSILNRIYSFSQDEKKDIT